MKTDIESWVGGHFKKLKIKEYDLVLSFWGACEKAWIKQISDKPSK